MADAFCLGGSHTTSFASLNENLPGTSRNSAPMMPFRPEMNAEHAIRASNKMRFHVQSSRIQCELIAHSMLARQPQHRMRLELEGDLLGSSAHCVHNTVSQPYPILCTPHSSPPQPGSLLFKTRVLSLAVRFELAPSALFVLNCCNGFRYC